MEQKDIHLNKVLEDLKATEKKVAYTLLKYFWTRNASSDDFISTFIQLHGKTVSYATIIRARQRVQNTLGIFPKDKKSSTWRKTIKELNNYKEYNNPFQLELF